MSNFVFIAQLSKCFIDSSGLHLRRPTEQTLKDSIDLEKQEMRNKINLSNIRQDNSNTAAYLENREVRGEQGLGVRNFTQGGRRTVVFGGTFRRDFSSLEANYISL